MKKLISLLLIMVMALSLCACGNNAKTPKWYVGTWGLPDHEWLTLRKDGTGTYTYYENNSSVYTVKLTWEVIKNDSNNERLKLYVSYMGTDYIATGIKYLKKDGSFGHPYDVNDKKYMNELISDGYEFRLDIDDLPGNYTNGKMSTVCLTLPKR